MHSSSTVPDNIDRIHSGKELKCDQRDNLTKTTIDLKRNKESLELDKLIAEQQEPEELDPATTQQTDPLEFSAEQSNVSDNQVLVFPCELCKTLFVSEEQLSNHIRKVHVKEAGMPTRGIST